MKAGLATEAAVIATETVDVGPSGVVGHPPRLGVERVILIYVVIFFVPGWKWDTQHTNKDTNGKSACVNTLQEHGKYVMG